MEDRQSFVLYKEWRAAIEIMTAEQAQQLMLAMFAYQDGEEIDSIITDPGVRMVFAIIKQRFDRDAEKYADTCRKRAENGRKGAEAKASKTTALAGMAAAVCAAESAASEDAQEVRSECDQTAAADASDENQALEIKQAIEAKTSKRSKSKQKLAKAAEYDCEYDNDLLKEKAPNGAKKKSGERFSAPTEEQVAAYCREMGFAVNPLQFIAYYGANGWHIGRVKMSDWRDAVRNWEERDREAARKKAAVPLNGETMPGRGKNANRFNNFTQRKYDFDALERQLLAVADADPCGIVEANV